MQPKVERRFAAVGGDQQHVVLARVNPAGLQCLGPFDQRFNNLFQLPGNRVR
jgi:hypothetical protein